MLAFGDGWAVGCFAGAKAAPASSATAPSTALDVFKLFESETSVVHHASIVDARGRSGGDVSSLQGTLHALVDALVVCLRDFRSRFDPFRGTVPLVTSELAGDSAGDAVAELGRDVADAASKSLALGGAGAGKAAVNSRWA